MFTPHSPMTRSVAVSLLAGITAVFAGWRNSADPSINPTRQESRDSVRQKEEAKSSEQSKNSSRQVALLEGERPKSQDVMIYTQSKLIEEGDAIKRIAENEANLNNVRFNINDFQIGYTIATEKSND